MTKLIPWTIPVNSMILRRQAVLGYPTFPVSLWVFRSESQRIASPRFLLAAWYTEHIWHVGKRFWRSTFAKWTVSSFFGNSRSPTSAQYEPVSLNTRKTCRSSEWLGEKYSQTFFCAIPHQDFQWSFQLGILPLMQKELIRRIAWLNSWWIDSQKSISSKSLVFRRFSVGKRASRPRNVPVQNFLRTKCCSGRSSDVAINWSAQIPEIWDAWCEDCVCRWERSSRTPTSRRKSIWRSKRHKSKTDSLRKWSTNTFEWLKHMELFLIFRICLVSQLWLYMSTISNDFGTQMEPSPAVNEWSSQWHSGRFVQTSDVRVWPTPNSIGYVMSIEITQVQSRPSLSQVEDRGNETFLDQRIRTRNFQAGNERIETGVLVKTQ